jgi:glycosyltransferase involved in cell wall biosynthesis
MIRLSILISAVPSRIRGSLLHLLDTLDVQLREDQAMANGVEILTLIDNKCRSVGAKRNALLAIAQGEYVAFLDDDDEPSDDYLSRLFAATSEGADVITFWQRNILNGLRHGDVVFGLGYENQEVLGPGTIATRLPWHICAWKREIAVRGGFPDVNDGEDWAWVQQVVPLARTETKIPAYLHTYRWSKDTTEATTRTWAQ